MEDGSPPSRRIPATGVLAVACCLSLAFEVAVAALSVVFPPPMTLLQHPSIVVRDWRGRWLRALPAEQGRWRIRPDLDRIDPVFVRRLIALEDARFSAHPGIDPVATLRAAAGDLLAGRVRSGGSTLDMQLARRLHPRRRTLWAKLIESLRALQLDAMLGKRGVLAAYLTLTPYGGDLEGVQAASLAWFGHPPDHLDDGRAGPADRLAPGAGGPPARPPSRPRPNRPRPRAGEAAASPPDLTPQTVPWPSPSPCPAARRCPRWPGTPPASWPVLRLQDAPRSSRPWMPTCRRAWRRWRARPPRRRGLKARPPSWS